VESLLGLGAALDGREIEVSTRAMQAGRG